MAACPTCRINHAPYTCAQYADLRRAENRADAHRVRTRSASARRACPVASTLLQRGARGGRGQGRAPRPVRLGAGLVGPAGWLGTGSQAEYERAAALPLCKRCDRSLGVTG